MIKLDYKNKLQVGEKYKYPQLCEIFGIEPSKATNTRKKHMTTIQQYVKLDKQGTWFEVVEIYDLVQEREDGRKDNIPTGHRESFFTKDELQLAILWLLGQYGYEKKLANETGMFCMPTKELYVAVGLCNEFYTMLTRNKYYYTSTDDSCTYYKWQVDIAFAKLYNDMKSKTITTCNQLQNSKVIEFSYWKCLSTSQGYVPFTEEQMNLFLEFREDTLEWFNNEHKVNYTTISKFYGSAIPKHVKEFEEYLKRLMENSGKFKQFKYYTSCFKINYSLRSVLNELTDRGFKVDTIEDFKKSFKNSMSSVVKRINDKFLSKQIEEVVKVRDKHYDKLNAYEQAYSEYLEELQNMPKIKGFGKRIVPPPPKQPFMPFATNDDLFFDTIDLLKMGVLVVDDLTEEQLGVLQGIEHDIEVARDKEYKQEQEKLKGTTKGTLE